MASNCECRIVAEFPILGNLGIISANLRTNKEISVSDAGIVLAGPTTGDLSVTAYAPLTVSLDCPGRAGVSYSWDRRIECPQNGSLIVHFVPRSGGRSYREGDVDNTITMTQAGDTYKTFSASASSGPTTPYLYLDHRDGYNFSYSGVPITVDPSDGNGVKNVTIFNGILPAGSELYLQSFSWEYSPPNVPTVSYSFLFSNPDI
jgi:hypothetical protein